VKWKKSDVKFEDRFDKYLDPSFFQHRVNGTYCLLTPSNLKCAVGDNEFMECFLLSDRFTGSQYSTLS